MYFSIKFLYHLLSERMPASLINGNDQPLRAVRIFENAPLKEGCLYLIRPEQLASYAGEKANAAFACCEGNALSQEEKTALAKAMPVLFLPDFSIETGFNQIAEALGKWNDWEAQLDTCSYDLDGIQKMLEISRSYLGGHLLLSDAHFHYLAITRNYAFQMGEDYDEIYKGASPKLIDSMLSDPDYYQKERWVEPFIYHTPNDAGKMKGNVYSLCCNLFRAGQDAFYARLMLELHGPGASFQEEYLLTRLAERINRILCNLSSYYLPLPGHENLRELIDKTLCGVPESAGAMRAILSAVGWDPQDTYLLICYDAQLRSADHPLPDELTQQLEMLYQDSCAVRSGNKILQILNLTKDDPFRSHNARSELSVFLREHLLKAGISNSFSGFAGLMQAFSEAEIALQIGSRKDNTFWLYFYSSYVIDYILSKSMEDLPIRSLCHPGVLALSEYDREHGTGYFQTLWVYIKYHYNTTHAAEALFIHRSTLLRHLERIESLTGMNLDDMPTRFHILYSYLLLGMV